MGDPINQRPIARPPRGQDVLRRFVIVRLMQHRLNSDLGLLIKTSFLFLFLFGVRSVHAMVPFCDPNPNPWRNIRWNWGWGSFGSSPFSVVIQILPALIMLLCLVSAFMGREKKNGERYNFLKEVGRMVRPSRGKLGLFLLFFVAFSSLALASTPFQKQWFLATVRACGGAVDFYILNLFAYIVIWYLLACSVVRLKRIYLLFLVLAVLLLLGFVAYLTQVNGAVIVTMSQSIATPLKISWLRAIKLVNECQAQGLTIDPYVTLKDGRIVEIIDPPGYDAMLDTARNASPKCGLIPVVPN